MSVPSHPTPVRQPSWIPHWWGRLRKGPSHRALTLAALEGAVVGGMLSCVEAWIVPLLKVRLHTSDQLIGLLTIAPMLAATLLGPVAAPVIARLGGNKYSVILTSLVQVICLLGLSLPLHFAATAWAVPTALTLAILINAVGAIGGPAWFAWMGNLVPRGVRGRFTSNRAFIFHTARVGFGLAFMLIMRHWTAVESSVGLQIILIVAVISRLGSVGLIAGQPEPPPRPRPMETGTARIAAQEGRDLLTFLRRLHRTTLGRWTLVWAALHFGVFLSGPYFLPYWLTSTTEGGLGLADNPEMYTLLVYTSTIVRMVCYPLVGRLVDHFGPAAMLRISVVAITVVPIGWAMTTSMTLLLLTEVLSGIGWCIAEVSVGVLLFSCSTDPKDSARLIGYHQMVCALTIVIATLIGGQLLLWLPPLDGSQYRSLFLASCLFRVPSVFLAIRLLPALRETRVLKGIWRLIPGLQPTITLSRGVIRGFRRSSGF